MSLNGVPTGVGSTTNPPPTQGTGLGQGAPALNLPPSLQQVNGPTRTPPTVVAQQLPQTAPSGGQTGLQQITGKANPLHGLSKKSDTIFNNLQPSQQQALQSRLAQADGATRKEIKALLHYTSKEMGATTPGGRLAIRETLAQALASGMDLASAKQLKQELAKLPDFKLQQLVTELKKPGASMPAALARHLVDPGNKTGYASIKDLLVAFPADPGRANQPESATASIALVRDAQGKLKVQYVAASLIDLPVPPSNQRLTPHKLQQIEQLFDQVASTKYSRTGVMLDFLHFHGQREQAALAQGRPAPSLDDSFAQYQPDGQAIAQKYGHGDCLALGHQLVKELANMGIEARLGGYWNGDLIDKDTNSPVRNKGRDEMSGVTHTDVLIPYTDANGQSKVLMLVPGMGNDAKWVKHLDPGAPELQQRTLQPDGGSVDAVGVQKNQLKWLTNLQLLNNPWSDNNRNIFGIDLAKGVFYLNGAASQDFAAQHGGGSSDPAARSIAFDFKAVLADPMARTTIKVWNNATNGYVDRKVPQMDALVVFLRAVQNQFGQPPAFVGEMLSLVANYNEYRAQVLMPTVGNGIAPVDIKG